MKIRFVLVVLSVVLLTANYGMEMIHAQEAEQRIEVVAKRFAFSPEEITLKKGQPSVLVFKSVDVAHSLRFKELGVEVKADKGKTNELRFTPKSTGDFVGHCGVFCGSGHGSMTLTLHVVE